MQTLLTDFKERFSDLKEINFPAWLTQPMLVDISNENLYQEELSEMQNDDSITNLFNIKGIMAWMCEETNTKYPNITLHARNLLLPFPSSYLVQCGFRKISDLLIKKRNRLDITNRGDLRLKLTKLDPDIKFLCSKRK
jgi:hypothetical protein